jgi:hypothetical protein
MLLILNTHNDTIYMEEEINPSIEKTLNYLFPNEGWKDFKLVQEKPKSKKDDLSVDCLVDSQKIKDETRLFPIGLPWYKYYEDNEADTFQIRSGAIFNISIV